MQQTSLQFFGVAGIQRKKKKPRRVIETDPEETIETNSSGDCSPKKRKKPKVSLKSCEAAPLETPEANIVDEPEEPERKHLQQNK